MVGIRHSLCFICIVGCRSSVPSPTADAAPSPSADARALKLTNPNHLPAYAGPVGSIRGRVVTRGPAASAVTVDTHSCPKAAPHYARAFREGATDGSGNRPLADAVVVVTGYSGFYVPETRKDVRLAFRDCDFETHTVTVTFGQQLSIVNQTDVPFAPRLLPSPPSVLLIAPPQERGDAVHLAPERPGYFRLVDQLGKLKYLELGVYVLLHPLHTVSALDGAFRIDGVPAQKVTLGGRLASGNRTGTREVDVPPGGTIEVELLLEP